MIALSLVQLLAASAAPAAQQRPPAPPRPERSIRSVTVQQRLIIRIPRVPIGRAPMPAASTLAPVPPPIRWVERRADSCVAAVNLAAATIAGASSIDLLLNGGKRLRARFANDCPALDFYSGLYVKMNGDGQICARRDSIQSRAGGVCRIQSFRTLVPAR